MEVVKVNDKELLVRNYNNERIVTAWDIAYLHNKKVKRINEVFKNNFLRYEENVDYFILNRENFSKSFKTTLPPNMKNVALFTEKGVDFINKLLDKEYENI